MKEIVVDNLSKIIKIDKTQISSLIEIPPSSDLGDFAFPCFILARELKKNPVEIAKEISSKIKSSDFEKVEAKGPYINFFLSRNKLAKNVLSTILKQKSKYGSTTEGKGKKIVIDMSSPNIAKPFGIGHLRSTIIGNSLSNIYNKCGYKTVKINYLGDWGTQFGKLIVGYYKKGNKVELKKNPIKHLLELYIEGNKPEYEEEARNWFKKLESGDKVALNLWKEFKNLSLKEFNEIYSLLNIKFDVISGESMYNDAMKDTITLLQKKNLLKKSEGAEGVDLETYGLGFCLIRKSDGATLYTTRDITTAIDRYNKYKFSKMAYEVGQEQKLHFQQVFKVLELMGYSWAKDCVHVYHGLYLDSDGKKFATRKGKTVFMQDIFNETINLAKSEIQKREKLSDKELYSRAKAVALAAIIYGDLKNNKTNDMIFDIDRFVSFEGNTGPYLLYSYARAKSILAKSKSKNFSKFEISSLSDEEKNFVLKLNDYSNVIKNALSSLSPNLIANYAFELSQKFNEFYHAEQVIGSKDEKLKLAIVCSFSLVLKDSLSLLGIEPLERM